MRILIRALVALTLLCAPSLSLIRTQPIPKVEAASASTLEAQKRALEAEAKRKAELAKQEAEKAKRLANAIDTITGDMRELEGSISSTDKSIADTQAKIAEQTQELAGHESTLRKLNDQLGALVRRMYIEAVAMKDEYAVLSNESVSEKQRREAQLLALKKSVSVLHARTMEAKMVVEKNRAELLARNEELTNLRDQQSNQRRRLASNQSLQRELKDDAEAAMRKYDSEAKAALAQRAKVEQQIAAAAAAAARAYSRGALPTGGRAGAVGSRVHRGDRVGSVGSTGYSTGPHVHLEVQKNGVAVNPGPYLSNGTISYPLTSFTLTQGFGKTEYSDMYSSGIHTGFDLATAYGSPVYAPADGVVILHQYFGGYGYAWVERIDSGETVLLGHMIGGS